MNTFNIQSFEWNHKRPISPTISNTIGEQHEVICNSAATLLGVKGMLGVSVGGFTVEDATTSRSGCRGRGIDIGANGEAE